MSAWRAGGLARWRPAALGTAVRRRPWLVPGIVAGALALAALFLLLSPARYTAIAEVVLDTGAAAGRAGETPLRADTELRILRSREMARAVGAALGLMQDAAFLDEGGLFGADAAPADPAARTRLMIDRLQDGLRVEPLAGTYSLAIGFTAADPQRAARIANGYAREYAGGRLAAGAGGGMPASLDRPNARLISEAEAPLHPGSPRPVPVLLAALAIGLVLGVGAAGFAEARYAGLTSSGDVQAKLGLHHLGSVPTLASVLADARDPLKAVVDAPMSAFAEAFRGVFMSIRYVGGRGTQVIAITSALPNEGKTTVAACLARSAALAKEPVVLIDCDARRRDTSALFVTDAARPGLAQLLRCEVTLDEVLIRDEASGAWILPLTGPPAEISELIGGQAMAAVIEDLRRRFKRVLIDTAPLLPISATRAIAAMADLTVIVVRWRATSEHAVKTALALLPQKDVRIGGAVLSQIDLRETGKYDRDDATFYYKQYSKYYS